MIKSKEVGWEVIKRVGGKRWKLRGMVFPRNTRDEKHGKISRRNIQDIPEEDT